MKKMGANRGFGTRIVDIKMGRGVDVLDVLDITLPCLSRMSTTSRVFPILMSRRIGCV